MDVLKITPPFTYSYQCGSTLLTSYLPIYMYSISLQIISTLVKLVIIFTASNSPPQTFQWLRNWLPNIFWPLDRNTREIILSYPGRLIEPYRLVTSVVENLMLFLSFGLCCPSLSVSITINIALQLSCSLMLIGRFVFSCCVDDTTLGGSLSSDQVCFVRDKRSRTIVGNREEGDILINLLAHQLDGVNTSLLVCKWPLIFTSCSFVTVLCWDMVGDQVGWYEALWVPAAGVVMVGMLCVWDQIVKKKYLSPIHPPSPAAAANSLELVHSSLHPSAQNDFAF
jgi:hypothetical protein